MTEPSEFDYETWDATYERDGFAECASALRPAWTHRCDICGMTNEGDLPLVGWSVYRGLLVHDETCRTGADAVAEEVGS